MKTYIPELSEQRMVKRAPNRSIDFGTDRDYIFSCLKDIEHSFGLQGFPCVTPEQSKRPAAPSIVFRNPVQSCCFFGGTPDGEEAWAGILASAS